MDNNQTIKEIYRAVGNLDGKVDGINNRLDKVNDNIAKNVKDIDALQTYRDTLKGKFRGIIILSGLIGGLAGIIGVLISAMTFLRK